MIVRSSSKRTVDQRQSHLSVWSRSIITNELSDCGNVNLNIPLRWAAVISAFTP